MQTDFFLCSSNWSIKFYTGQIYVLLEGSQASPARPSRKSSIFISFYSYWKDKRAKPGNLLAKRCSTSSLHYLECGWCLSLLSLSLSLSLSLAVFLSSIKGLAIIEGINRRHFTVQAQVQYRVSLCEIFGGRSSITSITGCCPSTVSVSYHRLSELIFLCQCHTTDCPNSFSYVSVIPPTVQTHFPMSVSYHRLSELIFLCQCHTTDCPNSFFYVSVITPTVRTHFPMSVSYHRLSTLIFILILLLLVRLPSNKGMLCRISESIEEESSVINCCLHL
jgi:hypothetical protein